MHGLYDGFEGYRVSSPDEVAEALRDGLVVLDANTLLNLYRYNTSTSEDLFSILERLGDRLVVPHQALKEFWRNRISAIGNPGAAVNDVRAAFSKNSRSTTDAVMRWAKQVALEDKRCDELVAMVNSLYSDLAAALDGGQPNRVAIGASSSDQILVRLEKLLEDKVTPELDKDEWKTCVAEGRRRADACEPPGYLDAEKASSPLPEGPSGDYLVWYQACQAAKGRRLDLVFVTGDEKDDWWWRHQSEFFGPRPELAAEMLRITGRRLFMLRPKDLLSHSEALSIKVRQESVEDAERSRPEYRVKSEWTKGGVIELLRRLDAEELVQAEVIRFAARLGGEVDRQTVYALGDFDDDRTLSGFTKPARRITADLQSQGLIADDVTAMLVPLYRNGIASAFRIPAEVVHMLQLSDPEDE